MSAVSDLHAHRSLSASSGSVVMRWESCADPVTLPLEVSWTSSPEVAIRPTNRREEAQGLSSFFPDGKASGVVPSERGTNSVWGKTSNEASDTGPAVLGGSWPELSESAKVSTKPSFDGPSSAMGSVNTPPMQRKFANCGRGGNSSDGVGTSGSFSNNVGPSSSSSITNSGEIFKKNSDKHPVTGNYSNFDQSPRDSCGWVDQGDRQRKHGGNGYRASYGSRHYGNRGGNGWNSYRPSSVRDPHMQSGFLMPPVMRPHMPAMMPMVGPPPPFQHFYSPMPYPDFPSQLYMLPAHSHPEHFRGYPFIPPLAPMAPPVPPAPMVPPVPPAPPAPAAPPLQPPTFFSWHEQKHTLILKQIEYYFSSENLCRDLYLRSNMDNHGWVSIHLIAGFKRMKLLTDNISLILYALRPSCVVEVEGNKVRKRDDWHIWILNRSNSQNNADPENRSPMAENQDFLVAQIENIALGDGSSRRSSGDN